jgi:hypothetical protein
MNSGTFLKEGMSSNRPPLFDGTNYNYWSSRMVNYVQAVDYRLWRIITKGPLIPTKLLVTTDRDGKTLAVEVPITDPNDEELGVLRPAELEKISLNARAINTLHQALCAEEYGRIQGCETAKQIWDCLETTHVGTSKVKNSKIRLYTAEYEKFTMKENESISEMHQRLKLITNTLKSLGKKYSQEDVNSKILTSLTADFRQKACAIDEAKDLAALTEESLMGSLLTYELELKAIKESEAQVKTAKRNLALQAKASKKMNSEDSDEDSEEDEDMTHMVKKFTKFYKKKFNKKPNFKKYDQPKENHARKYDHPKENQAKGDSEIKCYECNRPGHMRSECPRLK